MFSSPPFDFIVCIVLSVYHTVVVNKTAAWVEMLSLATVTPTSLEYNLGSGGSMASALLWVATRPDSDLQISASLLRDNSVAYRQSCEANFACVALAMRGQCCPTAPAGDDDSVSPISLGCCPIF